jgi:hypothetical protein
MNKVDPNTQDRFFKEWSDLLKNSKEFKKLIKKLKDVPILKQDTNKVDNHEDSSYNQREGTKAEKACSPET